MTNTAIASQYHASLAMLRKAVETCTDDLWDASVGRHPFWLIAYHGLYYADLYLVGNMDRFERPEFARKDEQYMSNLPHPPHDAVEIGEPYTKEQILSFEDRCRKRVDEVVLAETPESLGVESEIEWIPFSRFELHLYNVRHIQHHVAQLSLELKFQTGTGVDWIGVVDSAS